MMRSVHVSSHVIYDVPSVLSVTSMMYSFHYCKAQLGTVLFNVVDPFLLWPITRIFVTFYKLNVLI